MEVRVECYAGYRGEETPRAFFLGDLRMEVSEVLDRWLDPDHRYFKILDVQGNLYLLRHDIASDKWEVTQFLSVETRKAELPPPGDGEAAP